MAGFGDGIVTPVKLKVERAREVAQRRPSDLLVGAPGRCDCGRTTAWRDAAGRLWCEACWWATPAGRTLTRALNDRSGGEDLGQ
jgi:hypothetical protein